MNKSTRKLVSRVKLTSKQRVRLLREVRRADDDLYTLVHALLESCETELDRLYQEDRSKADDARLERLDAAVETLTEYVNAYDALDGLEIVTRDGVA